MSSRLLLIAIGITFLIQNEKALLCCFAITCMKKTTNKVFLKNPQQVCGCRKAMMVITRQSKFDSG
jgi:hypothetical protein